MQKLAKMLHISYFFVSFSFFTLYFIIGAVVRLPLTSQRIGLQAGDDAADTMANS
jgi:hypothetical protein